MKEIKTILIANRGEIARRVIRSCEQLEIDTIAIFHEEDRGLPYVKEATKAISLGYGSLAQTYLDIEKIVTICSEHNVDAVHPGYGLLSENTDFAKSLEEKGIIFIGPKPKAIKLMGDKIMSKVTLKDAPLIPGFNEETKDVGLLKKKAQEIGFPLLIKASAGGGGKGMRKVFKLEDFEEQLSLAQSEALKAFGNDSVLLEKLIENPRHIEIQVLSDCHGNHRYLGERECSLQRRYQKVIEEAPSPVVDEALRAKMGKAATDICERIDYLGAGTIEFLLDSDHNFYFLEMNTRLQVEHPVTELVTGIDLVEWQIRIAQGEKIDFTQDDVKIEGHSIEVRIYAEDPIQNFMPTNGRVFFTSETESRLDTAIESGNKVGTLFDPMIAKLISYGEDRNEAITQLNQAINTSPFLGLKTNRYFIKQLIESDFFQTFNFDTHTIDKLDEGFFNEPIDVELIARFLIQAFSGDTVLKENSQCELHYNTHQLSLNKISFMGGVSFELEGEHYSFPLTVAEDLYLCELPQNPKYFISMHLVSEDSDAIIHLMAKVAPQKSNVTQGAGALISPLPGSVFKILKSKGDTVYEGETILIVEAMKMEHALKAPFDGVVGDFSVEVGQQVEAQEYLTSVEAQSNE